MSADGTDLAPINATFTAVDRWLRSTGPAASVVLDALAYSPTFSDQSFAPGDAELRDLWTTGGWVSWLGGPAVTPLESWPQSVDGSPLTHVMTVSLDDLHGASDAQDRKGWPIHEEGLPTTGVLEVFHDLRSFGYESVEKAWLVRWVETPDRSELVEAPGTSTLDDWGPPEPVCQAGLFLPGWNLPPVSDYPRASAEFFDAMLVLHEEYGRAWMFQRQIPYRGWSANVTHAYGHPQHANSTAVQVLSDVLPLRPGDRYRLVLDIESGTHLAGWFGDLGNLQVWMRASDLAARNFDAAWCLIRTD